MRHMVINETILVSRAASASGLFASRVRGLTPNGSHFRNPPR